jgi:hypothetical protein
MFCPPSPASLRRGWARPRSLLGNIRKCHEMRCPRNKHLKGQLREIRNTGVLVCTR